MNDYDLNYDLNKEINKQQKELDCLFERLNLKYTSLKLLPVCQECGHIFWESDLPFPICPKCKRTINGFVEE